MPLHLKVLRSVWMGAWYLLFSKCSIDTQKATPYGMAFLFDILFTVLRYNKGYQSTFTLFTLNKKTLTIQLHQSSMGVSQSDATFSFHGRFQQQRERSMIHTLPIILHFDLYSIVQT